MNPARRATIVSEALPVVKQRTKDLRFQEGESLDDGIERIALTGTASVIAQVGALSGDTDRAVHEIRKQCKALRALARLVRDGVGEAEYHLINRYLRDMARGFAAARDSRVRLDTFDQLRSVTDIPGAVKRDLPAMRRVLVQSHEADMRDLQGDPEGRTSAVETLREAGRAFGAWHISEEIRTLQQGLGRTYGRGQRLMVEAEKSRSPEVFHAWRKRAKYLRHQLDFLNAAWPAVLGAQEDEVHRLTDLLGDANDLVQLERAPGLLEAARPRSAAFLRERMSERSNDLWDRALRLGERIYAEHPGDFSERVAGYYETWRDDPPRRPTDPAPAV